MQTSELPRSLGEYQVLSMLGKGQYGKVYLCKKFGNNLVQYAVKVIDIAEFKHHAKLVELLRTEKVILEKLDHPNILKCYDSFRLGEKECLVLHYCDGGDLENYLKGKPPLSMRECIYFLKQLVNAFLELHHHKIMHRDFKPANVLVNQDTLMIADFGFASMGTEKEDVKLGTPLYSAPEINDRKSTAYSNKVDMWSLGLTLYHIIFKRLPWEVRTKEDVLLCSLTKTGINLPIHARDGEPVSPQIVSLLKRMIEPDVIKRISWDQLKRDPVFEANEENAFDPMRSIPIFRNKEITNSIFTRNKTQNGSVPEHEDWNNHVKILQQIGGEVQYPSIPPSQFGSGSYRPLLPPVSPVQQYTAPQPVLPPITDRLTPVMEGVFDRIYHEKRVSMYFQNIADKIVQAIAVIPRTANEVKGLFCSVGSLLSKLALQYNAQLMEALLFGDNIFELPQAEFKTALQLPKMKDLIHELTKDNESQAHQLEQQRGQLLNQDSIPEDVVQILFDDRAMIKALRLKVEEAVGTINVYYRDLLQLVTPELLQKFQEALAHLNIVISYETQFKYLKETGLFNWHQFEKNVRDPKWVEYYLGAILKEK